MHVGRQQFSDWRGYFCNNFYICDETSVDADSKVLDNVFFSLCSINIPGHLLITYEDYYRISVLVAIYS